MLSVAIVTSHPGYDSIVSPFVLPFAQTCIYTSLLAPLWRQVESPVSFPETETLLPTPLLPLLSVGLSSGTQSATLLRL
jgi:hypothetical protein